MQKIFTCYLFASQHREKGWCLEDEREGIVRHSCQTEMTHSYTWLVCHPVTVENRVRFPDGSTQFCVRAFLRCASPLSWRSRPKGAGVVEQEAVVSRLRNVVLSEISTVQSSTQFENVHLKLIKCLLMGIFMHVNTECHRTVESLANPKAAPNSERQELWYLLNTPGQCLCRLDSAQFSIFQGDVFGLTVCN